MAVSAPQLSGIQMLRGIAATLVVLSHTLTDMFPADFNTANQGWLTTTGAAGVDLFFVVSGFIILYVSFPAQSAPLKPGLFLFRRATRIYPLYWICVLAAVALLVVGFVPSKTLTAGSFIKSLLLVPIPEPLIGVSWTLSYEVFFYLIFAATLVFRSRAVSALLSTVVITAATLTAIRLPDGLFTLFLSDPVMLEFCFGLLLALAYSRGLRATSVLWMVPGFLLIITATLVFDPRILQMWSTIVRPLAWGLPSVVVLAGFLAVVPSRRSWTRFAMLMGDASYSIYLTHLFTIYPFKAILARLTEEATAFGGLTQFLVIPLVAALAIAICVAVGIAVHIVIEAPLLALVRNLSRSRRGGVLAGESSPGPSV